MTRFRQVTSPASGLLRSSILDRVLFGNRLTSDRLLGDCRIAPGGGRGTIGGALRCAMAPYDSGAGEPDALRFYAQTAVIGVTTGQLASSSTSARVWAVRTRVDQRNRVSASAVSRR